VTADYEAFHFNTMVAKLMELTNLLSRYRGTAIAGGPEWEEAVRLLLLMLAPAAPHIAEELWSRRLAAAAMPWSSIHAERWPEVNLSVVTESTREVPVQVNGKVRDRIVVPAGIDEAALESLVLASPRIQALLAGRTPARIVHAGGGKLVNLVLPE
jgi:leucyl-tRNA synthetase